MQAVEFLGEYSSRLVEKSRPLPGPGIAVVQVSHNSVCGSDLWLYRGRWHGNRYPVVPGHEWSGVVVDTDPQDAAWAGRRVVGDLLSGCGTCRTCRRGMAVMCSDLEEIGFTTDGAMAEFVRVPVRNLYEVPETVGLAAACQVEPLAVALHAMDRLHVAPGERVAVFGCGGIGLLLLQAARAAGAEVVLATDPLGDRRGVAASLGATAVRAPLATGDDTFDCSADVVLEASGDPASVLTASRVAAPGGRIGLIGYQVGAEAMFQTAQWPLKTLTTTGVMGPNRFIGPALDLLARAAVDVAPLLTHVEPLAAHEMALHRAMNQADGVIRVVFTPNG